MSEEENMAVEAAPEFAAGDGQALGTASPGDEHTTAPNPAPASAPAGSPDGSGKWEMPKPVFQQSSGYLPQGFVKDLDFAGGSGADGASEDGLPSRPPAKSVDLSSINLSAPAPAEAAVEPQPDLSEQIVPDEAELDALPVADTGRRGVRPSMLLLGLAALVAFAAVFLIVIYFLFFKGSGDPTPF